MAKRTKIDYNNIKFTWYLNGKLSTESEAIAAIKNKSDKIQQSNKSA